MSDSESWDGEHAPSDTCARLSWARAVELLLMNRVLISNCQKQADVFSFLSSSVAASGGGPAGGRGRGLRQRRQGNHVPCQGCGHICTHTDARLMLLHTPGTPPPSPHLCSRSCCLRHKHVYQPFNLLNVFFVDLPSSPCSRGSLLLFSCQLDLLFFPPAPPRPSGIAAGFLSR